jgi:hypothetical protein
MFVALVYQNITVAGEDYRGELLIALAAMVVADLCCAVVFLRGGGLRWVAVVIALPSVLIVLDVLRRAPYVWGRAPYVWGPDL